MNDSTSLRDIPGEHCRPTLVCDETEPTCWFIAKEFRKATLGLVSIKSTQPEARPEVGKDSQLLNGFAYCINKDFLVVNNAK